MLVVYARYISAAFSWHANGLTQCINSNAIHFQMKISSKIIAVAAVLTGALAPSSLMAIPMVTMQTYSAAAGGNFRADPNADLTFVIGNYATGATDGTWFGTFCLEKNEYFSPNGTYKVTLNDRAIAGGLGSPTVGYDIISQGTAYLYTLFATGALAPAYYGNSAEAAKLQNVIWALEDEQAFGSTNAYTVLLSTYFGASWQTAAKVDYSGSDVKVMNLVDNNGGRHQDQLVFLGDRVPDSGWTLALLGSALLGLALAGRRTRKV